MNIYEPVLVDSVEDAILATILNGKIAGLPGGVPADRDAVGAAATGGYAFNPDAGSRYTILALGVQF